MAVGAISIAVVLLTAGVGGLLYLWKGKPKKKDSILVASIAAIVFAFYMSPTVINEVQGLFKTQDISGTSGGTADTSDLVSGGCNTAPAVTYGAFDRWNTTQQGSATNNIKIGLAKPVTSYTAAGGETISYLPILARRFISPVQSVKIGCNGYQFQAVSMDNSTGGHTFNVFNDLGNVMTAGGGVDNLSLGSGAQKSVRVEFSSPSRQASAPFGSAWCLEGSSKTNLDSSLTAFPGVAVSPPQKVTLTNAAGFVNCVEDSTDISNGATVTKFGTIKAANGVNPNEEDIYVHIVAKQWFVDTDGNFKLGYQDSNNVDQSPNDYIYNFEIE